MSHNGYSGVYKEKLSIDQIVLRQLDRRNHLASYDFESGVKQGLNNLPMSSREWVLSQSDRYTEMKDTLVYKAPLGRKIGHKDNPAMHDPSKPVERYDDGSIDWSDKNISSPKLIQKEYTDYHEMDAVIMEAYQIAGLTFNEEMTGVVLKNRDVMPKLDDKPRPYLRGKIDDEEPDTKP